MYTCNLYSQIKQLILYKGILNFRIQGLYFCSCFLFSLLVVCSFSPKFLNWMEAESLHIYFSSHLFFLNLLNNVVIKFSCYKYFNDLLLFFFSVAALNSQYFEEDYSTDEDFQPEPPADDWKKV